MSNFFAPTHKNGNVIKSVEHFFPKKQHLDRNFVFTSSNAKVEKNSIILFTSCSALAWKCRIGRCFENRVVNIWFTGNTPSKVFKWTIWLCGAGAGIKCVKTLAIETIVSHLRFLMLDKSCYEFQIRSHDVLHFISS